MTKLESLDPVITTKLCEQLLRHEGFRGHVYKDSVGKSTIGIGRNVHSDGPGITQEEANYLLRNDINRCVTDLDKNLPWWRDMNPVRQQVLLNMCFNMGIGTLLKFNRTLNRMRLGNYSGAAAAMLESLWAEQVGARAKELADMMEKG